MVAIQFLRSLVFFIGMAISSVIYTPIALSVWFVEPVTRSRIIGGWAHFVVWWLRVTCGLRHEVSGLENLPDYPVVILSKHQSAWETIAFQTLFPAQAWVLKKSLLKIPFFGWGLAASHPIAIDRSRGVKALDSVITDGIKRLAEGRFVVVFPEGTRMSPGETSKYNPGGAMLAVKAKVPVLPVVHNAGVYWRRRGILKRPGVIKIKLGELIETEGKKARQINQEVQAWIEDNYREL